MFSLRSVPVLGIIAAFLFIAGCTVQPGQGNQTPVCGDKIVSGNEQCDVGSPCKNASLVCSSDCACKPPEKKPVTCADNSFKASNGSANTFNSSTMVCKDDCSRISSNAVCDATTCLCRTETRTCVKNSIAVSAATGGNNTFNAALMLCRDDCATLDPNLVCDAGSCTCKKKENETVYCVNNTKEVALTHNNTFNKDTMQCKDDCARLGPDFFCNQNCTCFQQPKIDIPCGGNTIVAGIFGNPFNPATMVCKDDCVATFGAGWKCDGPTCTCSKKPPEKESCAWNSFGIAFGAPNTFDPAKLKCEDDCKDIGPGWVCDGKTCTCSKAPDKPVSCTFNGLDTEINGVNNFNFLMMECKDDCEFWGGPEYYCDGIECACKKRTGQNVTNKTQNCAANTLTVNYPKGPLAAGTQCKDDCKTLGSSYVCDPQGCFCKETRTVTPRCGDGYVSGPNTPGGGFEECDVGFGFYQPKDAAGNPITKPDTCPSPKVCDAKSCKCLTPVVENYTCGGDYGLVPGSDDNIKVPDSFFDVFFCVELPRCGDGKMTGNEQCDWNSSSTNKCSSGSYCTNSCECKKLETSPRCGDGKISVETGEQCDGGSVNTNLCPSGYKCYTPECQCVPLEGSSQCGDGSVVAPEECDHGNSFTAQCSGGEVCSSCQCVPWEDTSHTECDFSHGQCVTVPGPGQNECSSDSQCEEEVVQECGNGDREGTEQCDGNDDSACSSGAVCNQNCQCQTTTTVTYHFECSENACVQVQGPGSSVCNSDDDCVPPVLDCASICSSKGYSTNLGGGYSSGSECQAENPTSQPPACTWVKSCFYYYTKSNQAGTSSCCCKDTVTGSCTTTPQGCTCPTESDLQSVQCPQ